MARESAYDKGSRLLAEGRVIVLEAGKYGIAAHVRGEGHLYVTRYGFGSWRDRKSTRLNSSHH